MKPGSRVFEKVNAATGRRLPVYVVLREDKYESAVGDGIFRYFDSAFFDRSAAELSVAELLRSSDTYTYYIRKVSLAISNKDVILDTEGCALSPFDYFTRQEICEDLARGIPRGTD